MALSILDIESDLIDLSDFEELASVSRAKKFITAGTRWLILRADSASNQSSSQSIGKQYVENLLRTARDYVARNAETADGGVGGVRFLGVGSSFR